MPNYNISINRELAQIITREMKSRKYSSRSEFFRDLVRDRYVVGGSEYAIEELPNGDKDTLVIKRRKKEAHFVPLHTLLCS